MSEKGLLEVVQYSEDINGSLAPKTAQTYLSALKSYTKFLIKKQYLKGDNSQMVLQDLTDRISAKSRQVYLIEKIEENIKKSEGLFSIKDELC